MGKEQFAEKIFQYVKTSLPEELAEVQVHTTSVDLWDSEPRAILLIIRPWTDTITDFYSRYCV